MADDDLPHCLSGQDKILSYKKTEKEKRKHSDHKNSARHSQKSFNSKSRHSKMPMSILVDVGKGQSDTQPNNNNNNCQEQGPRGARTSQFSRAREIF